FLNNGPTVLINHKAPSAFSLRRQSPKDYIRCMECLNMNIDERIKTKEMFIKTYQSDSITNYIKRI
ncbi:hypothetical protein AAH069_25325, partial [Bacteroides thetaiotaomicron]